MTVAGAPGIGKSRLAGEFVAAVGDDAMVLAGRCLAYGEGTTYRALADIVHGLGGEPRERLEELLAGDEQALRGILSAIGQSEEPAQPEETAWALRRLLERLARERPLVVAIEDIHWAEPALLDLLDHVVALSSRSPILLVCLTRPELLDTLPAWGAPQPNRSVLVLDALGTSHARELAERLGAGELADADRRARGGQPAVRRAARGRRRGRRRRRAADEHPGGPRRPHRSPAVRRARAAAARGRRGAHVPRERGRGAAGRPRSPRARRAPRRAGPQGAHRLRPARLPRRGRVSLHPRPHPRGRLRERHEARPRRPAREARRLARGAAGVGGRDRRLPPRAGRPPARRARAHAATRSARWRRGRSFASSRRRASRWAAATRRAPARCSRAP